MRFPLLRSTARRISSTEFHFGRVQDSLSPTHPLDDCPTDRSASLASRLPNHNDGIENAEGRLKSGQRAGPWQDQLLSCFLYYYRYYYSLMIVDRCGRRTNDTEVPASGQGR